MSAWVREAKRCDLIAYLQSNVTTEMCAFVGVWPDRIKEVIATASDDDLRFLVKSCEKFNARRGVA